jgi:serine/threonine-protein kinase
VSDDRERLAVALPAYEIGPELGRGGFGIVLEGRHRQLGRAVAIKELPRSFGSDPEVKARFLAEARILATLDHPHVVPIYDYVEADGVCLLVMEKLSGGTLWDRFTTDGLPPQTACAAILATAAGLHCAHQQGILHRDIKPENLIFSGSGTLKVTDFGISTMLTGTTTKMTAAGEILGTPAYMAPEQAAGAELSPATDVYAVGVMLYELLSGRLPFSDEGGLMALLYQRVHEDAPALEDVADVPLPLADVAMQALERDPAERFEGAEDLGLKLAEAATSVWGPGWLSATDLPVLAASTILAVTERSGTRPVRGSDRRGPATRSAPVRPTIAGHAVGAVASEVRPVELVPASAMLAPPPRPIAHLATALGLLVVAIVVALVGIGSPRRVVKLPEFTVGETRIGSTNAEAKLDLAKKVTIAGLPDGTKTVELSFSTAGIPLGSAQADVPFGNPPEVDVSASRFLVPSIATGKVTAKSDSANLGESSFTVKPAKGGLLTAPTAVTAVLALFAIAYGESLLRSLRRGRRPTIATIGVAISGALIGAVAVLVAWVVGVKEPTLATLIAAAIAGAGSGIAAALGAARTGRRRRARRR